MGQKNLAKRLAVFSLGLERGTVELLPYNPQWTEAFELVRQEIIDAVEKTNIDIEHIGSTAIPGCPAKPILDILLVFEPDTDFIEETQRLEKLGFLAKGAYTIPGEHLFNLYSLDMRVDFVHIHALARRHPNIDELLTFRDCIRNSKSLTEQYASLKKNLFESGISRKEYPGAKTEFVKSVLTHR